MTIGITGASGHLGRRTTDALLERVDPGDLVLVTRDPSKLSEAAAAHLDELVPA
jgi:NAD(P)H dehydrogenase (quinone)